MSNSGQRYGVLNADGTLQVDSNDGKLRIVLSHKKGIIEGNVMETFRTTYFVKDGLEWERTLTSQDYKNTDEFLQAISLSSDFTEAIKDIRQQKGFEVGR